MMPCDTSLDGARAGYPDASSFSAFLPNVLERGHRLGKALIISMKSVEGGGGLGVEACGPVCRGSRCAREKVDQLSGRKRECVRMYIIYQKRRETEK